MSIDVLADGLTAYRLGQASFALIFPIAGALLLGFGIHRRRAFNRWNRRDDDRLLRSQPSTDDDDPPQPPSKGTALIVTGAVIVLLGAGHVLSYLAVSRTTQSAGNVEVGQCITAGAYSQGRMDSEAVDCRVSDATMELVSSGDGEATCPDGSRNSARYPALVNESRTHCFALNLREDHCYAAADGFAPANCTDPAATVKVASRVDGVSEARGCPAMAKVVSYLEPPRVYCFVAP